MKLVPIAAALVAAAAPLGAFAASASDTIQVTSTVSANCIVQTNDLNFGYYDPIVANAHADLNGSTQIVVHCTQGSHPILLVGEQSIPSAASARPVIRSDAPRSIGSSVLSSGSNLLNYTFGLDSPAITTGISAPTTWTLRGTVAGGQDQPIGSYSDTLSVGVNF